MAGGEAREPDPPIKIVGTINQIGCRPDGDGVAGGGHAVRGGGHEKGLTYSVGLVEGELDGGAGVRCQHDGTVEGGRGGVRVHIARDDDAERLVAPGLQHPGTAALPVELVFDAPVREALRIFSAGGGGVELHAPGADLRDHHHVVGVRREGEAGVRKRHVPAPGREAVRRRQGRAGRGGKLVRGGIRRADLDVEVVAFGVVGVDDHPGERVAARVGPRAKQLPMFVATGVGAVIGQLECVGHEGDLRLRLRRGRPEEQQARDEDGGGRAVWTGGPTGPGSIPRAVGRGGAGVSGSAGRAGGVGWPRRGRCCGELRRRGGT